MTLLGNCCPWMLIRVVWCYPSLGGWCLSDTPGLQTAHGRIPRHVRKCIDLLYQLGSERGKNECRWFGENWNEIRRFVLSLACTVGC